MLIATLGLATPVLAQESSATDSETKQDKRQQGRLDRLQSIGLLIKEKRTKRDELASLLKDSAPDAMQDERENLASVKSDLDSLRASFELALLEDVDTQLMFDAEGEQFNWQDELLEVVEPLLSSLKSMTERPRQLAELHKSIELDTQKLAVAKKALLTVDEVSPDSLNEVAAIRLQATSEKWNDSYNLINERLMNSRSQLSRLQNNERSFAVSLMTGLKGFFSGRGLTVFIAIFAAIVGWAFMRICWHIFNTKLVKKSVRRKATWYRVLAYSYQLFTLIAMIGTVMTVLYLRQDVLLMGLAFLALASAFFSLRAYLPRCFTEVRYLLNLGAVKEDECVIHAGLPWQVMSLNILTVLRNPALDGVIRLPLNVMTTKESRPLVRDEIWYPTARNDYVILPDQTFGQVLCQTPDLVNLSVKGGMSLTVPTAEFYATSVLNLSRSKTFGIAVNFGLDYSLQDISLSVIPTTLKIAVISRLRKSSFHIGRDITNVVVELAKASSSSIDFLIYTTVSCDRAVDYYTLERLVQQACVAAANDNNWLIPFPQLTLHYELPAQKSPLKRAA